MIFSKNISKFKVLRFKFSDKFFSFIKFRFIRATIGSFEGMVIAIAGIIVTFEDREVFTMFPET